MFSMFAIIIFCVILLILSSAFLLWKRIPLPFTFDSGHLQTSRLPEKFGFGWLSYPYLPSTAVTEDSDACEMMSFKADGTEEESVVSCDICDFVDENSERRNAGHGASMKSYYQTKLHPSLGIEHRPTGKFTVKGFKKTLEQYISPNRLCSRNLQFWIENTAKIPDNILLIKGTNIRGMIHYWWCINGKIYDPTVHQFIAGLNPNIDADNALCDFLNTDDPEVKKIKKAFKELPKLIGSRSPDIIYDESVTDDQLNEVLSIWYDNYLKGFVYTGSD
ncbi:hypothetical protein MP638_004180 [Amoeboaphelidium occidentale]|nr:hypothetical protein MP638_004180 [Amoeboaphelidium occidentale]